MDVFILNEVNKLKNKLIWIICFLCVTGCSKQTTVENQNKQKIEPTVKEEKQEVLEESSKEEDIPTVKEEPMVQHFEAVETEVSSLLQAEKTEAIKETIAQKFIMLVDFIYYDSQINGVRFKDLTMTVQDNLKNILSRMDMAIETQIPEYKDTLKEKYHGVTNYVKEKASNLKDKVNTKVEETIGTENYNNFKEAKDDMKESFKNTGSAIADTTSTVYQKGKDKVKNWYENLKEKYES